MKNRTAKFISVMCTGLLLLNGNFSLVNYCVSAAKPKPTDTQKTEKTEDIHFFDENGTEYTLGERIASGNESAAYQCTDAQGNQFVLKISLDALTVYQQLHPEDPDKTEIHIISKILELLHSGEGPRYDVNLTDSRSTSLTFPSKRPSECALCCPEAPKKKRACISHEKIGSGRDLMAEFRDVRDDSSSSSDESLGAQKTISGRNLASEFEYSDDDSSSSSDDELDFLFGDSNKGSSDTSTPTHIPVIGLVKSPHDFGVCENADKDSSSSSSKTPRVTAAPRARNLMSEVEYFDENNAPLSSNGLNSILNNPDDDSLDVPKFSDKKLGTDKAGSSSKLDSKAKESRCSSSSSDDRSVVFCGTQRQTSRRALPRPNPRLMIPTVGDLDVLRSLKATAGMSHVVKPLSTHPYIEPFYQTTLSQRLETRSTPLPLLEWVHQILTGISELHARGIVHRDINPRNIFVRETDNQLFIGDFGDAYMPRVSPFRDDDAGTRAYMDPQLFISGRYNQGNIFKADIFNFGIVMLELFCPTFRAQDYKDPMPTTGTKSVADVLSRLTLMENYYAERNRDLSNQVGTRYILREAPDGIRAQLTQLVQDCLNLNIDARPSAEITLEILTRILGSLKK